MLEDEDNNRSSKPLRGVVLCCTAILPVQRSELAATAAEMGATHKLDLTSDVTHLIVGDTDTPKYKYVAKERPDVKVLKAEWVAAVRDSWLEGGATDVEGLERKHRLPTFAGLRICLTGFEDQQHRDGLAGTVQAHGAEYSGDLTKQITHLITAAPKGKKYEYAKQWKIKIVSTEWLDDSIERGMILDESLYDPLMKPQDRGKNAFVRRLPTPTSLGKRAREAKDTVEAGRRKLRRTASSKLTSQNEGIWADITAGGSAVRVNEDKQWEDTGPRLAAEPEPPQVKAEAETPTQQLARGLKRASDLEGSNVPQDNLPSEQHHSIFHGVNVYLHGFTKKQADILADHLSSNGATVNELGPSTEDLITSQPNRAGGYVVIPHTTLKENRPSILEKGYGLIAVTEWWVERCLCRKFLVDPSEDTLSRPFDHLPFKGINSHWQTTAPALTSAGFEHMVISSTNFDSMELLHLSKTVILLGATYDDHLKPHASALICNSVTSRKDKLMYASDQGIPAVSIKWLLDSVERGQKMPFDEYLVQTFRSRKSGEGTNAVKALAQNVTSGTGQMRRDENLRPGGDARPRRGRKGVALETSRQALDIHILEESPSVKEQDLQESYELTNDSNSLPLSELQPEVNSPKKASQSSTSPAAATGEDGQEDKTASSTLPSALEQSENNLHEQIKALRANMSNARPVSAGESSRDRRESSRGRRRRGLLGRAASGLSIQSTTGSISRASSIDINGTGDVVDPASAPGRIDQVMPSQILSWEDEDITRQKAEVLRRMGGKVDETTSARVASIGLVKDSVVGDGGVGSRVRRRPRQGGRGDG